MADKYQYVRFKSNKNQFEVLCNPGTVLKYRDGQLGIDKVLFAENVYKNFQTGDKAKESDLVEAFGTANEMECIQKILDQGEYSLSTKERQELVEKKRKEMITFIHKQYVDPRTKVPHPLTRIETVIKDMKLNVDPFKPAEKQVEAIYSKLVEKMPLKKTLVYASLSLKHQFIGKCMPVAHRWGQVSGEQYDHVGVTMDLAIVPGDFDALVHELHNQTKGDYTLEITGSSGEKASLSESDSSSSSNKKGSKGKKK
jgi:ribosome maturation protein SDO1